MSRREEKLRGRADADFKVRPWRCTAGSLERMSASSSVSERGGMTLQMMLEVEGTLLLHINAACKQDSALFLVPPALSQTFMCN